MQRQAGYYQSKLCGRESEKSVSQPNRMSSDVAMFKETATSYVYRVELQKLCDPEAATILVKPRRQHGGIHRYT